MNAQNDSIEDNRFRLEHGIEAQQKGDLSVAISYYNAVTSSELVDPAILITAYERRGLCHLKKDDFDSAIADYSRVIERMPDHRDYADVYKNRGLAYFGKGDFDSAIADFTKAIQLYPEYARAYRLRGVVFYKKGEIFNAIEDFSKVIELHPNHPKAYYNRGMVWLHLRKWEKARSDLTIAINRGKVIPPVFHRDFGSIVDFQRRIGVYLPADIVSMLTLSYL